MFPQKFCAHRGLSALMPENTLPAFAAAQALGADEIEFDVRLTKDGQLVVCHDPNLERISDGVGLVSDYTLEELRRFNVGTKHGWQVGFCTPEEVFARFADRMTLNIHLKQHGEDGCIVRELLRLIEQYRAHDRVYFAGSPSELEWMQRIAPTVRRVAIQLPKDTMDIAQMAKQYHCSGVQFWVGMFDKPLIEQLHRDGLWCNLYYADCADDYHRYFEMGIDTLLTNRMDLAAKYKEQQTRS